MRSPQVGGRISAVFADGEVAAAGVGTDFQAGFGRIDLGLHAGAGTVDRVDDVLDRVAIGQVDGVGGAAVGDLQSRAQVESVAAREIAERRGQGQRGIQIAALDEADAAGAEDPQFLGGHAAADFADRQAAGLAGRRA